MNLRKVTEEVAKLYQEAFGQTPLDQRRQLILDEAAELKVAGTSREMFDEAGDLLSCLLALCSEMSWDPADVLKQNLNKIERRIQNGQYTSLGRKTKVCLIGGAFDPIHLGHTQLGELLLSIRKFDEVWFVPANHHMHGKKMTDVESRLELCYLATNSNRRFKVFPYEIDRNLAGETYNFVNRLLGDQSFTDFYSFSYCIGLDNANNFHTWVNYELLRDRIPFIVVARQGVKVDDSVDWYRKDRHSFIVSEVPILETSSTEIRGILKSGWASWSATQLKDKLDPKVCQYIQEHNIYTTESTNESKQKKEDCQEII